MDLSKIISPLSFVLEHSNETIRRGSDYHHVYLQVLVFAAALLRRMLHQLASYFVVEFEDWFGSKHGCTHRRLLVKRSEVLNMISLKLLLH